MTPEFDVKMSFGALYDFKVQHSYKQPISIISTAVGVVFLIYYVNMLKWYYLAAALLLILYLPVSLFRTTFIQIKTNQAFAKPIHYVLNDEGITVSIEDASQNVEWNQIIKARNTSKSYILYTSKTSAFIFPLKDMGDKRDDVLRLICANVDPKKVKIRFGGL